MCNCLALSWSWMHMLFFFGLSSGWVGWVGGANLINLYNISFIHIDSVLDPMESLFRLPTLKASFLACTSVSLWTKTDLPTTYSTITHTGSSLYRWIQQHSQKKSEWLVVPWNLAPMVEGNLSIVYGFHWNSLALKVCPH